MVSRRESGRKYIMNLRFKKAPSKSLALCLIFAQITSVIPLFILARPYAHKVYFIASTRSKKRTLTRDSTQLSTRTKPRFTSGIHGQVATFLEQETFERVQEVPGRVQETRISTQRLVEFLSGNSWIASNDDKDRLEFYEDNLIARILSRQERVVNRGTYSVKSRRQIEVYFPAHQYSRQSAPESINATIEISYKAKELAVRYFGIKLRYLSVSRHQEDR